MDDIDYETVKPYAWCVKPERTPRYASSNTSGKFTLMHRLILGCVTGDEVDHINGNGLDNRRSNLRLCSRAENRWNVRKQAGEQWRSKYKGVSPRSNGRAWVAIVNVRKKRHYLGRFPTEEAAARAYDEAARRLHGAFARVNFPEPLEVGAL